jgi:hypothetical protein
MEDVSISDLPKEEDVPKKKIGFTTTYAISAYHH